MPLRKSPTMTPARLAANRRSALLSTGPKTAQGKARSCLNRLSHGERSANCEALFQALMQAPPGTVRETASAMLRPEELRHPVYASLIEHFEKVQQSVFEHTDAYRSARAEFRRKRKERRMRQQKNFRWKPECPLE